MVKKSMQFLINNYELAHIKTINISNINFNFTYIQNIIMKYKENNCFIRVIHNYTYYIYI